MSMPALPQLRWRIVAGAPAIAPGGLHLWRLPLEKLDETAALALLSQRQRGRWERLRTAPLRRRYLGAQAGCRRVLGSYLGLSPDAVQLRYGPAGKPDLNHRDSALQFNLTTTGDLALLAVRAELPVGIDCELERERPDLLGIAARMLEPAQTQALAGLPAQQRLRAFYLAWTALEARVKEDGRGLTKRGAPDTPGLRIAHALAGSCGGATAVCAVAGAALPQHSQWEALQLTA
jgi:4'-phosphopantetheinyl transferase